MPGRRRTAIARFATAAVLLLLVCPLPAYAEERTVTGKITTLDPAGRAFTVTDATGTGWNYKVAADAGIDLHAFKVGDRVTVTIARATPRNMMSAADLLKKGDTVVPARGY